MIFCIVTLIEVVLVSEGTKLGACVGVEGMSATSVFMMLEDVDPIWFVAINLNLYSFDCVSPVTSTVKIEAVRSGPY